MAVLEYLTCGEVQSSARVFSVEDIFFEPNWSSCPGEAVVDLRIGTVLTFNWSYPARSWRKLVSLRQTGFDRLILDELSCSKM